MSGPAGTVVWLTGLPSSGKSLLAQRVLERLRSEGAACCLLDGDEVRAAIRPSPGYDDAARADFYGTLAELAALLARQGLVVLVPATANLQVFRDEARRVAPRFVEVHVDVPLEVCMERDAKGLYARARAGELHEVPGAGVGYEVPASPDVVARGGLDEEACVRIANLALAVR